MTGNELRRVLERHLCHKRPDLAWEQISASMRASSAEERHIAHLFAPFVARRLPGSAWNSKRRQTVGPLGISPELTKSRSGQVAFPVVPPSGDEPPHFVHVTVTSTTGQDRLPDLECTCAKAAIGAALDAARDELKKDIRFHVSIDSVVQGSSLGLGVALAAWSEATGFEIADHLVATGKVEPNGDIKDVGKMDEKLLLRDQARPCATLLAPLESGMRHPSVAEVGTLAAAIGRIEERDVDSEAAEYDRLCTKYEAGDWRSAAEIGHGLLTRPGLDDNERVNLIAILLCAANHHADPSRADDLVAKLEAQLSNLPPGLSFRGLGHAFGTQAVYWLDKFDGRRASQTIEAALSRHEWSETDRIHLVGTQALCMVLEGRLEDAARLRKENVERARTYEVSELPRCLGDYADTLRRASNLGDAKIAVTEALEAARESSSRRGYVSNTRGYLHLYASRIYRALGETGLARSYLDTARTANPELAFRLELERCLLAPEDHVVPLVCDLPVPWMREARVMVCLEKVTRVELGDVDELQSLAEQMGLASDISAEELLRRFPY